MTDHPPPTGTPSRTASMMNKIVASALEQPTFLVVLLLALLVGAGLEFS